MSLITETDGLPFKAAARGSKPLVIVGGGPFAVFLAYETLRRAAKRNRPVQIILLAEKFNVPATAGTHVVLEMHGLFRENVPQRKGLTNLLRQGLQRFESMIERENIQSRYRKGYEIKAETQGELDSLITTLIEKKIYKAREITPNSEEQVFKLARHDYSAKIDSIGQINAPELMDALLRRIKRMGGVVRENVHYIDHKKTASGDYIINTSTGEIRTRMPPVLATGAKHQSLLREFNTAVRVSHTMGLVMGPLSPEDAAKIASAPMAFCDKDMDGDVMWGGLDERNYFTIGFGDIESDSGREELRRELTGDVDDMFDGITRRYKPEECFGAVMIPDNGLPLVGRLSDYSIGGGWGGYGIIAGYAAARAHARWLVDGKDDELLIFEGLQPGRFTGAESPRYIM